MSGINAPTPAGAYTIYRAQGSPTTIKGPSLGIDIKDGSLIVTANGQVSYVFGPTHGSRSTSTRKQLRKLCVIKRARP